MIQTLSNEGDDASLRYPDARSPTLRFLRFGVSFIHVKKYALRVVYEEKG